MFSVINDYSFAVFSALYQVGLNTASLSIELGVWLGDNGTAIPDYDAATLASFVETADLFFSDLVPSSYFTTFGATAFHSASYPLLTLSAFMYTLFLIAAVINSTLSGTFFSSFAYNIFYIAEQEFASANDFALIIALFASLLSSAVLIFFFGSNLTAVKLVLLVGLTNVLYLVLAVPFNLIYNWGSYFPIYVKGQSINNSVVVELVTDYVHMLSFFLSINIQLISLVIIGCVFYMYNELYVEFVYPSLSTTQAHSSGSLSWIYAGALFLLKLTANMLYEIGHLWIIVGMQSGAFMMIVFVITQFLYSVYLLNSLQPFLVNLSQRNKF